MRKDVSSPGPGSRRRKTRAAALIVVGLLSFAQLRVASAEDTPAKERAAHAFIDGEKAFAAGEYARAAKLFEEAYAARPHPSTLVNAAKARRLAGHLAEAANHFRRIETDRYASARDLEEARAALAELTPSLARLIVRLEEGASSPSIDGVAIRGAELYVDPGDHVIEASPSIRKEIELKAGQTSTVVLEASHDAPTTTVAKAHEGNPRREVFSDHPNKPIHPWMTFTGVAATLILGGVTIWSGVDTLDQRDAWDAAPSNRALDLGLEKQERTNILIGVTAGVALLTGVLAYFTDWKGAHAHVHNASPSSPSSPSIPPFSFKGGSGLFGAF